MRCLLLGAGAVVSELYLPAMEHLGWIGDVCVADPSAAAIDRVKSRWPALRTIAGGVTEGLAQARTDKLDAVIIAAPNAIHEEAASAAIAAGFDVLCEKPLAMTTAGCERLDREAQARRRILAVGMTRRFTPAVKALRAALDAGWIGDVSEVIAEDGYAFSWATESGNYFKPENGGVLANLGVHTLDTLRYLLGELTAERYRDDWGGGVEANATFVMRTSGGAPVTARFSYTHPLRNHIRIRGQLGELTVGNNDAEVRFRAATGGLVAAIAVEPHYDSGNLPTSTVSAFVDELADFRDAIRRRRAPRAQAVDAIAAAKLMDWAIAARAQAPRISVTDTAARIDASRIVITGGTGFVGGHLVEALGTHGRNQVVVPVRSHRSGANAGRFPVELARADLLDRAALKQLCTGARYVFHLAYGRDGDDTGRVTIEGTRHLVEAAIESGVEAVVVASSTSVFGDPGGAAAIDETAPNRPPPRAYEKTKADAERWTMDRARSVSGTRVVVVSPSCVYGPGGKTFTEMPAQMLAAGHFAWIEDGRGIANYVYVKNLVDGFIAAAVTPQAHGQRYIISDGWITWRGFFEELFGDRLDGLPSYTGEELRAAEEARRPTMKDLGRAVVRNPELWRVVRENRRLAGSKALLEKLTPGVYSRVKAARQGGAAAPGSNASAATPQAQAPSYLEILFGPTSTMLSSAKARAQLQWKPRVNLQAGQAASRAWLEEIGLWPEDAAQ
ncbi:MAG TPA: NAD-dependent epimerase/dehydratase family protein [Vicinamibacterales bacterium]|nr:NAD-dependent epimerase/dehydratase family protein [Vicinamibacterales bacterium]